ncbi:MAG: hypothetical protein U0166_21095 [Acidobacteriota bacterium]
MRSRRQLRRGQTTVEYTLLAACFAIPISYYFFPKMLNAIYNAWRTLAFDLSGPGI